MRLPISTTLMTPPSLTWSLCNSSPSPLHTWVCEGASRSCAALIGTEQMLQLPMAFGMSVMEELAAICTVGRIATQLFLTDGEPKERPLLLRMATDCSEGRFM